MHDLVSSHDGCGQSHGIALDLSKVKDAGFPSGNWWLQLEDHVPSVRAARHSSSTATHVETVLKPTAPFRVLFVCTANICRSAYADVVASGADFDGVEFSSAGTHALVGQGIDPPMANHVGARGDVTAHVSRQLTRQIVMDADLALAMGFEHRRYILDSWPALGRKVFLIGHVAREMSNLPESVTLESLVSHLWKHRSADPSDAVADPYRRGPRAAADCAGVIDAHLEAILAGYRTLIDEVGQP